VDEVEEVESPVLEREMSARVSLRYSQYQAVSVAARDVPSILMFQDSPDCHVPSSDGKWYLSPSTHTLVELLLDPWPGRHFEGGIGKRTISDVSNERCSNFSFWKSC
jgi:hypothetical protein